MPFPLSGKDLMQFHSIKPLRLPRIGLAVVWVLACFPGICNYADGNDQDLFRLGTVHYQRGQWDFAIQRFEEILKTSDDAKLKSLSRFYLAESLVAKKQYSTAQKHLKDFLKSNASHQLTAQARFRLGEVSYLIGDRDSALLELTQFVQANPDHPLLEFALPYLGELRIGRGQVDLAVELFQKSLKAFPAGSLAYESRFGLARALEKKQSINEAERFYAYLVSRPESGRAADSLLQLAKIRFRQKKFAEAEKLLERFSTRYPNHSLIIPVRYWQGRVCFENEDWKGAEEYFRLGLKAKPKPDTIPALRYELAKSLSKQQRAVDAISQLKIVANEYRESDWADDSLLLNIQVLQNSSVHSRAIELCHEFYRMFPNSPLQNHVIESEAECLFETDGFKAAEDLYSHLLEQASEESAENLERQQKIQSWKYKLAVCLIEQEKISPAMQLLETINNKTATKEVQLASLLAIATIQIDRNQHAAATRNLIRYVETNPNGDESEKCIVDIALLLTKRGDFLAAEKWAKRLHDLKPEAMTLLQMADIAFASKRFVFASQWYSQASKASGDESVRCEAMMGNVWSAKELGNIESTILLARRVADTFPDSKQAPEALYLMAVLYEKSRDHANARIAFKKLLDNYPESPHRDQVLLSLINLYRSHSPENLSQLVAPISQMISGSESAKEELLTYELAWILKNSGEVDKARQCFERLEKKYPDGKYANEARLQVAEHAIDFGNRDEGIRILNRLATKNTGSKIGPLVLHKLGRLYFEDKQFASASGKWDILAKEFPQSELKLEAIYWSAESRYRSKDWEAAANQFAAICKTIGNGNEFLEKSCLRLGQASIKLEKWNAAIDAGRQLIDLTKNGMLKAKAEFVVGRAYSGLGLFSKARSAYEKVVENESAKGSETAAMAQWMIGECWFHQEKFSEAIDAYQRAEILHSWPQWQAAALLQAAKCFERQSKFQFARENCNRILANHADSEFAVPAKELLNNLKKNATTSPSNQKQD